MSDHEGHSGNAHRATITEDDRLDLLGLLEMRFGQVPDEVREAIAGIVDFSQVDHLIIVGANAASWEEFIAEVRQPGFRIVGQGFDPLSKTSSSAATKGDNHGS